MAMNLVAVELNLDVSMNLGVLCSWSHMNLDQFLPLKYCQQIHKIVTHHHP